MSALSLSLAEARRIALAAQGFAAPARTAQPNAGVIRRATDRQGVLQLDSVNVAVRAHYMPLFSRLGPYAIDTLDALVYEKRHFFEYWGHVASILPIELFPLFRHRMVPNSHKAMVAWVKAKQRLIDDIYSHVEANGPTVQSNLPGISAGRKGPWWGWADEKRALEHLFTVGALTTTTRRNFERVYDLTERVIPEAIYRTPVPARGDAIRALVLRSTLALGVGTAKDIADYYRLAVKETKAALGELASAGDIEPVRVEGWTEAAWRHPAVRAPRSITTSALLTPFDPIVWDRGRASRLFGFDYKIEIYVPAPKRVYGYYVMPYLLDDRLAGRVDIKADRKTGTLRVPAAFVESGIKPASVADHLAADLRSMADWLGLDAVDTTGKGSLGTALRRALRSTG
ncbi:MAG: winged helix-turn-helix domain-containing protein [Acidimicrobiales bacterium]